MSESTTRSRTRQELTIELSVIVNELTEIRHHSEIYESEVVDGTKRKRVRKRHMETYPSLLDSLLDAMQPASTEAAGSAGFESRPSAEMQALAVIATITRDATRHVNALGLTPRKTLAGTLHGLVGAAKISDNHLGNLVADARSWLHTAKVATGWETASFTLNQPCPYCEGKNRLIVTGDLERARCSKCGAEWDEMTVGLLGQMLAANETLEVMTQATCDTLHGDFACGRLQGHDDEHRDDRGHYWMPDPNETMSA